MAASAAVMILVWFNLVSFFNSFVIYFTYSHIVHVFFSPVQGHEGLLGPTQTIFEQEADYTLDR